MIDIKTCIQNIKNGKALIEAKYTPFDFLDEVMDIYRNQTIPENWLPVNFKQDTEKMVMSFRQDIITDFQSRAIKLQDYSVENPRNKFMLWVAMYDMILIRLNPYSHDYEQNQKKKYALLRVGLGGLGKATDLSKQTDTPSYRFKFIEKDYFLSEHTDSGFKSYGQRYTIKPCDSWWKSKLVSDAEMRFLVNERAIVKEFAKTLVLIDATKKDIIYKTAYTNAYGPVSR